MSQYSIVSTTGTDSIELTDGTDTFRVQVRGTALYFDHELTATGFDGAENTDWINISSTTLPGTPEAVFRLGARESAWRIDQATDATGFSGAENVNWENIESHNL